MSDVVVLGDVNADIVARLESYPPPGGDAQPLETRVEIGGTSLNTAIMLRRLGFDVALVARVGCDVLGDFALSQIERAGMQSTWMQRDEVTGTGVAYVAVTPDGERTLLGGAGANRNLDVRVLPADLITRSRWLHVTSYSVLGEGARAATEQAIEWAGERAGGTSLDIGIAPLRLAPDRVRDLAARVNVMMPSGNANLARQPGQILLRKQGSQGCTVEDVDGVTFHVPAFSVAVVDGTGAGDAFDAGFIAGRLLQLTVRASALLACACGASAVTVLGAGNALPSCAAVARLLRECAPAGWEREANQVLKSLPALDPESWPAA